jgi:polyhydroxyalkanoate synthase
MGRPLPLLSFYLGQALQAWAAAQGALPYFFNNKINLNGQFAQWPENLRQLNEEEQKIFFQEVHNEVTERFQRLTKGITTYLTQPVEKIRTEASCIWQEGTTRLWDYAPEATDHPIILLIPSLINKHYIFDLDQDCSLIHYLKQHNLRPWVVDWQNPGVAEKSFSIEEYLTHRLLPILQKAYTEQGRKVSVLGYCMGGILALGLAHITTSLEEMIDHLILIATPWDFSPLSSSSSKDDLYFPKEYFSDILPPFPKEMVQFYFHSQSPEKALQKFAAFADFDPSTTETKRFIQIEEWVNDGVSLSASLAFQCFQQWVQHNHLEKDKMCLQETVFDLRNCTIPTLILTGEKDTIVPPSSSLALTTRLPHHHYQSFPLGHIGLIISKNAPELSWKSIRDWLQLQEYFP